ncbi:response regulator transcription factor [Flavobacterium rhizosphaerae]|uniref:Response regulator transcription factor n=1 Tax=Flavobacterium rhizosphaerae TaxID=3163298 RepID=A0ABW8YUN9_9FLAO
MTKILIVEDESGIVNFLEQGLREENYETISATNGAKGLEMALEENPSLVLLDWMMPVMHGLEVCIKLREKGFEAPIIFLTAKDTVPETIEGLRAGANDYIKKPFSFDELLERIRIHLRYTNSENNDLAIGNVQISVSAHKVLKDGVEISFTQREFDLLAYLVKNKGIVCNRKQIIEDVWDIHFDYDTGVIDVFINAIRKKLDLKKDEDFIKTVRGIGYIAEEI